MSKGEARKGRQGKEKWKKTRGRKLVIWWCRELITHSIRKEVMSRIRENRVTDMQE